MFALTLDTLVLRGVSVLRDGQTVGVRLGTGYSAGIADPEGPISVMRHPSPGCRPGSDTPAGRDEPDAKRAGFAASGAGRSLGLESRSGLARSTGQPIPSGWKAHGGTQPTAATRLWPTQGLPRASVGQANSGQPASSREN
jgi:hypothetical protein